MSGSQLSIQASTYNGVGEKASKRHNGKQYPLPLDIYIIERFANASAVFKVLVLEGKMEMEEGEGRDKKEEACKRKREGGAGPLATSITG